MSARLQNSIIDNYLSKEVFPKLLFEQRGLMDGWAYLARGRLSTGGAFVLDSVSMLIRATAQRD